MAEPAPHRAGAAPAIAQGDVFEAQGGVIADAGAQGDNAGANAPGAAAAVPDDVEVGAAPTDEAADEPGGAASALTRAREVLAAQGMTRQQAGAAVVEASRQQLARQHFFRYVAAIKMSRLASSIALGSLSIILAISYVHDRRTPCSFPISQWALVALILWASRVGKPFVDRAMCCVHPNVMNHAMPARVVCKDIAVFLANVFCAVMGIYWTAADVHRLETPSCEQAAPDLFRSARVYAWCYLAASLWAALADAVLRCLLRRIIRRGLMTTSSGTSPQAIERNTDIVNMNAAELDATPSCPICMEDYAAEAAPIMRITRCGHCFHEQCLRSWLKTGSSCPLCREELVYATAV